MKEILYKIDKRDLFDLFGRMSADKRVLVPYKKDERLFLDEFDPAREEAIELGAIRQDQPAKSFINLSRENVLKNAPNDARPLVLAGIKGCDLSSFILQDFVFKFGDVEDPLYSRNRDSVFIIGCDCTYAKETCFCLAMDGAPYPRKYFDIALSPIDDFFIVEAASARGAALIANFKMFFPEASGRDIERRNKNRNAVSDEIKGFIDKRGTPAAAEIGGTMKKNYNLAGLWQDSSSTCVECGACNLICPTCHCFLLFDEKSGQKAGRFRVWDSCLYKTFARVAGGANPRRHLHERLRNRFDKKFGFFPEVLNYFACTGCGRCIEACPGDIDIREVLKGMVKGKWEKPPHI